MRGKKLRKKDEMGQLTSCGINKKIASTGQIQLSNKYGYKYGYQAAHITWYMVGGVKTGDPASEIQQARNGLEIMSVAVRPEPEAEPLGRATKRRLNPPGVRGGREERGCGVVRVVRVW